MELNRERIIKGLECCCGDIVECQKCAYVKNGYNRCKERASQDALALIKELTEEVADLKAIAEGYQKQFEDCYAENERLHASCTELEQVCKKWQGRLNIECEYTRADTVQKYREALYRAFAHSDSKDKFNKEVFLTKADQIAKEMLEGAPHTNNANTCICCGAIIPEGVLTCPKCDQEREV